jgi:hypothetical protein
MMEGATRNSVYTVLKGVYTRSLDESRVYEKEVENIQKTNIKERRRGRDSTLLLLLGHGRDESRTCRTKERRISQMRVAKAAAAMLGRIILEKKTPQKMLVHGEKPAAAEPKMVRTFLLFQSKMIMAEKE